jgi:hypothetical protein
MDLAVLADRFVRGHAKRIPQLVRHDDRAHVLQVPELDDLVVDRIRRDRIEPGGRLVVEQDARLEGHGARNRHAPPLAAGQLRRLLVDMLAQADEAEHLLDAAAHVVERHVAFFVQLVADVLGDGERVEQRAFLKDHPEVGAHLHQLALGHRVDALAVHPDHAGVGPEQPQDQLEDRGLPGAAGPEEDLRVTGNQREAHLAENDPVVERQRHLVEHDDRRARPEGFFEFRRTLGLQHRFGTRTWAPYLPPAPCDGRPARGLPSTSA